MTRAKKAAAVVDAAPETAANQIAASAIQPIVFGRLKRAPENVRQTNIAADVESLADDIAAHGLLQSLIGYAGDTSIDKDVVWIVGGGRRLQALQLLRERDLIDDAWPVSVLLRAPDEAIELSLSENLARRDMNPADEFAAFAALMRPGTLSPADLAKNFGFTERYVKQRLRLAALAPEILDALRGGKLTLDGALAYAGSQDHKVQLRVFAQEAKKSWKPHDPHSIGLAYHNAQMTSSDALFKFVTAEDYEKKGGGYEDDLFGEADRWGGRKLTDAAIVLSIAKDRAAFQQLRLLSEAKDAHPTMVDVLIPTGVRQGAAPKPPKGYKLVDRGYRYDLPTYTVLREQAGKAGIEMVGVASVNGEGKLVLEDRFYVPVDRIAEIIPPPRESGPQKTPEEYAAERRAATIRSIAAWLAAKRIREEKIAERQFWATTRPDLWRAKDVPGIGACYSVGVDVLVTPAEIDAQLEAAEIELDRQEAEKAALAAAAEKAEAEAAEQLDARRAELLAMDPPPVVVQVDGVAYFQWADGGWFDVRESGEDADFGADSLAELLEPAGEVGFAWATLEAYDADPHGDMAAANVEPVEQAA
jgi:ParB family chromosome partitioning protein